ncbi:VCBS domain-containing protein, partial [Oleiphilus sp. HI0067]
LREGETRTETFQIQVDDGHGGIVTQSVSIIVEGTNDSPAIRGRATGSVIEDQVETVSGRLRDGDPDRGDTHTWSIDGGGADQYGQLTVDQNGRWRYTLDRTSPDTQGLGDGESVTVQHTVRVIDSQGAASTKVVSVVINGTNDKPLMAGQFSGTAKEDVTPTISGQLTPDDADKNDTHSWRVLNPNASYGSLSIDGQGKWTFSLHPNSASVKALSEGQVIQQTFRVEVRDQHGERTIKQVVIDVEGTNDLPTIRGQNTGSVTEDLIGQTSGSLTAVDVDALDTHTWKVVGSQQGRFGGLTIDPNSGKWTFVLDHNSPDTKALGHGQKTTESFIVEVDDGHGGKAQQIITVEIIG